MSEMTKEERDTHISELDHLQEIVAKCIQAELKSLREDVEEIRSHYAMNPDNDMTAVNRILSLIDKRMKQNG